MFPAQFSSLCMYKADSLVEQLRATSTLWVEIYLFFY
jgi:hypothetical protein